MDQEDAIRERMKETRTSLTEKLESLEQQVAGTVRGATSAVTEKVEAVKETVEETVSSVKETVHKGVVAVREAFDVRGHGQRHPWPMLAGSVAVGFVATYFVQRQLRSRHSRPHMLAAPGSVVEGNGRRAPTEPALMSSLLAKFGPEISKLKNIALTALLGTVREKVMQSAPEEYVPSLQSFFDSVGEKITGQRVPAASPNQL